MGPHLAVKGKSRCLQQLHDLGMRRVLVAHLGQRIEFNPRAGLVAGGDVDLRQVEPERRVRRLQFKRFQLQLDGRCVLALVHSADDPRPLLAQGSWEGRIALTPSGSGGFGYDPYFIPDGFDCTAAELSAVQKNALSHRGVALRDLIGRLAAWA